MRIGVIGLGVQGRRHARVWDEMPGVELVGMADTRETALFAAMKERPGVNGYDDPRDLMAYGHCDLVSVATPAADHLGSVLTALQWGAHVLVEKPIALDAEQVGDMIDASLRVRRMLTVGMIERFNPAVIGLVSMLGVLGPIYTIRATRSTLRPERVTDVGVGLDLAIHDVDLMRFILSEDPTHVQGWSAWGVAHELQLSGLLRFPNAVCVVDVNWLARTKQPHLLTLTCLQGTVEVDLGEQTITVEGESIAIERREPLAVELNAFVDAVLNDSDPPVSAADALKSLEWTLALLA